jgi:hypothetical protein
VGLVPLGLVPALCCPVVSVQVGQVFMSTLWH